MFDKPKGGTELMYDELMRRLPDNYKEHFSIFNYLPHADFSKTTIYWNQLSYDQDAVQFLKDPQYIDQIDHFVFVSNWQAEMFRKIFNIPGYKTHVIKNACIGVESRTVGPRNKVRLCYTSTPWRGLDVLLRAWEILQPQNCELHVFSSTKIYGKEFGENDPQYEHLYKKCQELSGVVYRGSIPNEELRKELPTFDILAYPNTFEETSCIAVIEALSAGLRVITSNLGALPETTEGWARMYPYLMNTETHAEKFAKILAEEIEYITTGKLDNLLSTQTYIYKPFWSWDKRYTDWENYLDDIILNQSQFLAYDSWDKQIFKEVYINNEYDINQFSSDDVIIDLGTHIGSFSKLCYDKGARKIYGYEADLSNYQISQRNLNHLSIQIFNKAVWRSDEDTKTVNFGSSPIDSSDAMKFVSPSGNQTVETIKLDSILSQFDKVKLLKVDIEGSEYPVLYTCSQLDKVEEIIGEYHEFNKNESINGYSFDKQGLIKFLQDNKFEIVHLEESFSNVPNFRFGFFKAQKIK
jgi:FkbM family methyltransferase